jgi:hypothetical protein
VGETDTGCDAYSDAKDESDSCGSDGEDSCCTCGCCGFAGGANVCIFSDVEVGLVTALDVAAVFDTDVVVTAGVWSKRGAMTKAAALLADGVDIVDAAIAETSSM